MPECMLNVVRRELSWERWLLQNLFFASNFKYGVEFVSLSVISSNFGTKILVFPANVPIEIFGIKADPKGAIEVAGYV